MLFNSIEFLLFFPIVVGLFFVLPRQFRLVLMLIASYLFYMAWKVEFILLILLSTMVDYWVGIKMGGIDTKPKRKPYLWISLASNLLILGTFKYYFFFTDSITFISGKLGGLIEFPQLNLILPMGISFYTFQTLSYSLDVYKGKIKPEKNILRFALYVTFFPQLVAGPIERAKDLLSQFHFEYKFDIDRIYSGLSLIMWGLFKKIVIADQLYSMVQYVFETTDHVHGFNVYFGSLLFSIQVYCDFAGYSDIAQGAARVIGVRLMDNFQYPFFSKSYSELWAKWHISLMQWFRDYIMFPLIRKKYRWELVFMLVFLISGLWHGADWSFIAWGGLNGVFLVYSKSTKNFREKIIKKLRIDKTPLLRHFLQMFGIIHLFAFAAIFFISPSFDNSWVNVVHLFTDWEWGISNVIANTNGERDILLYLGKDSVTFCIVMAYVFYFIITEWRMSKTSIIEYFEYRSWWRSWSFYLFILFSIVLMSNVEEIQFVYFQF